MKQNLLIYPLLIVAMLLVVISGCEKEENINDDNGKNESPTGTFKDSRDGNVYKYVTIGDQVWMAENLKYLPEVHSNAEFRALGTDSLPAYGVYGYDGSDVATAKAEPNYTTYGVLYSGYAVNSVNICPSGWHVSSYTDWTELVDYLSNNGYNYDGTIGAGLTKLGKSLASTSGWGRSSIIGAVGNTDSPAFRNKTGFSALPGGGRYYNGRFEGGDGRWWIAAFPGEWNGETFWSSPYVRIVHNSTEIFIMDEPELNLGFSVRCVRD